MADPKDGSSPEPESYDVVGENEPVPIDPEDLAEPAEAEAAEETPEEAIVEEASPAEDWLSEQFKRTPWWAMSLGIHGLILMFCWLTVLAVSDEKKEVVVAIPIQERPPEPEYDENKLRDIVKSTKEVETDSDLPPVENPVVVKDFETSDHNETANNEDFMQMKGDSTNFLSNQPFKGYGALDVIGTGGGAGGAFGGRFGGRRNLVARGGGSKATESAVEAALLWLKRHQDEDGKWDADGFSKHCGGDVCTVNGAKGANTAVTGMSLLAFLGAGHTHKHGKFRDTVRRGLEWMITIQKPDGDLRGDPEGTGQMYAQGIATMALVEAYGMTNDYKLKEAAQKAVDFIVEAQNPYSGWRYTPKCGDNDTSVVGWQVMALKSAKMAKLNIPPQTWEGARNWVEKVASGEYKGYFGYNSPAKLLRTTAIGMVCLMFMGDPPGDQRFEEGAKFILESLPSWGPASGDVHFAKQTGKDFYYWYYATLAMNIIGGPYWKQWNEAMKAALLPNQRRGGHADGSWDPENDPMMRADRGGRVLATAIGALCMEVYYRYNLMLK
ncbi:MAG: prenyltransferase/squalene oxidase repeat-containing protein [Planctomycetota bacterium]